MLPIALLKLKTVNFFSKMRSFAVLAAFFLACTGASVAQTYQNPILSSSSPDPFVTRIGNFYYMVLSDSHRVLSVLKNDILTDWRNSSRKTVYTAPATMDNLYAPEMHIVQGELYIYFTMDDGIDDNHRMYVLQANNPTEPDGSYTFLNRIAIEPDYFAIDGTVFEEPVSKQLYFLWSGWENATLGGKPFNSKLYIAPMVNATHLAGPRVMLKEPTEPWEGTVNEGPEMLRSPTSNRTFMVYSAANTWDDTYCLSMAYIEDGKDPMQLSNWIWTKEPIFSKNEAEDVQGPGHGSFTTSPDGKESWLVYHAMNYTLTGTNRTARAQKFLWNLDGSPEFGVPRGFGIDLPIPSGQV